MFIESSIQLFKIMDQSPRMQKEVLNEFERLLNELVQYRVDTRTINDLKDRQ